MILFEPLVRNPHLQTILAHFWKRPAASEFPVERRLYCTESGVQVLLCSQRPAGTARGELVMVHGLEGSGEAGYIRSLAAAALRAGFAAHRFHMRTCGGTENLCQTLYHAGLTSDLLAVLQTLRTEGRQPVILAGFSLGGNVVLKLAGELGERAREYVEAVCGVSTPLDLGMCARRIAEPDNRLYQARFVRRMRARLCATGRYSERELAGLHTVIELDDRFTAPSFGFGGADNYYRTQSAIGYLDGLRVPALLIQAQDDTFVPFSIYNSAAVRSNPWIRLETPEYGGHLGFLGRAPNRFWLDRVIMKWVEEAVVDNRHLAPSDRV
jgi:predicted alpha/beta-fold hydrolase